MARFTGPVLVDTNTIIEAHRVSAWKALVGGYHLETVEMVQIETHTGFQRRDPAQAIDQAALRDSLKAIHPVSSAQEVALKLKLMELEIDLDAGEFALWAHLLQKQGDWRLCGPDRASMRFGVKTGQRDRMVSLEALLTDAGMVKTRPPLRDNHTKSWLDRVLAGFAMQGLGQ
jgi:hypothetical protein